MYIFFIIMYQFSWVHRSIKYVPDAGQQFSPPCLKANTTLDEQRVLILLIQSIDRAEKSGVCLLGNILFSSYRQRRAGSKKKDRNQPVWYTRSQTDDLWQQTSFTMQNSEENAAHSRHLGRHPNTQSVEIWTLSHGDEWERIEQLQLEKERKPIAILAERRNIFLLNRVLCMSMCMCLCMYLCVQI